MSFENERSSYIIVMVILFFSLIKAIENYTAFLRKNKGLGDILLYFINYKWRKIIVNCSEAPQAGVFKYGWITLWIITP